MLAAGNQATPERGPQEPLQGPSTPPQKRTLCPSWSGASLARQLGMTNPDAKDDTGNLGHCLGFSSAFPMTQKKKKRLQTKLVKHFLLAEI